MWMHCVYVHVVMDLIRNANDAMLRIHARTRSPKLGIYSQEKLVYSLIMNFNKPNNHVETINKYILI